MWIIICYPSTALYDSNKFVIDIVIIANTIDVAIIQLSNRIC
ncbi:MAG: hypothetical protein RL757_1667, partial [Bacteroidota bacterium]